MVSWFDVCILFKKSVNDGQLLIRVVGEVMRADLPNFI
ncbi:hypothetical protein SCG7109_AL_00150 [Chlamydiales bacterium SCGC AG-110-M15]|nr:hypothetical protein SCG7109_AL_00150 [Chlamydiales bacterium SCGC AG-110-M15]